MLDALITCGSIYIVLTIIAVVILGVIARNAPNGIEDEDGWRAL